MKYHKMKSTLAAVTVGLCLLLSTHGYTASCEEGTEFKGKDGHVFCKSNVAMTWYSAFSWCEAQGRQLATAYQVCGINPADETLEWSVSLENGRPYAVSIDCPDVNMDAISSKFIRLADIPTGNIGGLKMTTVKVGGTVTGDPDTGKKTLSYNSNSWPINNNIEGFEFRAFCY